MALTILPGLLYVNYKFYFNFIQFEHILNNLDRKIFDNMGIENNSFVNSSGNFGNKFK
jgi:hypothetical protein